MHVAALPTTHRFVAVLMVILAIHSSNVYLKEVCYSRAEVPIDQKSLTRFYLLLEPLDTPRIPPQNPCIPSPCGPNSQCRASSSGAVCSCVANYIGRPPNCRPECTINSECPAHLACMNTRCSDPCVGSCGNNAHCQVSAHAPICICEPGYTGDPFSGCYKVIPSMSKSILPLSTEQNLIKRNNSQHLQYPMNQFNHVDPAHVA